MKAQAEKGFKAPSRDDVVLVHSHDENGPHWDPARLGDLYPPDVEVRFHPMRSWGDWSDL